MTFAAQVVHIIRKDIRQSAWELSITGLLFVMAIFCAARWMPSGFLPESFVMYGLWFAGFLSCVAVMHNDPPALLNRFWASKPIDVMALCSAKVVTVLLIMLVLPLAAEALALVLLGMPSREIPALLGESISWLAPIIPALALTGVLTSDLKSFTLAWLGMGFAFIVLSAFGISRLTDLFSLLAPIRAVVIAVWYVGATAAVVACYRVRDFNRKIALVAVIVAYWPIVAAYSNATPSKQPASASTPTPVTAQPVFDVDSSHVELAPDATYLLHVYMHVSDTVTPRRIVLSRVGVSLDSANRRDHTLFASDVQWQNRGGPSAVGGTLRLTNPEAVATNSFTIRLPHDVGASLESARATIRLAGLAVEYQLDSQVDLALSTGARQVAPPSAYEFSQLGSSNNYVSIQIIQSELIGTNEPNVAPPRLYEYLLVNDSLHAATALSVGEIKSTDRAIVLPGNYMATKSLVLVDAPNLAPSVATASGSSISSLAGDCMFCAQRTLSRQLGSQPDPRLQALPYRNAHLRIVHWTRRAARAMTLKLPVK